MGFIRRLSNRNLQGTGLTPVSSFVLEDSNTQKWLVKCTADGVLYTQETSASAVVSNLKVTGGSNSEAAFAITTDGELQVLSTPVGGEVLNDDFRIRSLSGGKVFRIGVNSMDQITTTEIL